MEKCKGCGVELLDGTVFCPYCGTQVQNFEQKNEANSAEVLDFENQFNESPVDVVDSPNIPKEKVVFKIFAIIGMVFGIINLVLTNLSILLLGEPDAALELIFLGLYLAVPGFVFGCIGKKSISNRSKGLFAFIANLICLIVLIIVLVIAIILISLFLTDSGSGDGGFYF